MITLVGFAVSNYYNKVKLALLEKGIEFQEELNWATKDEVTLSASPLGKVPFIRTDAGPLSESQVIVEYLEDFHPEPALLPREPYQRAKVRELLQFLELHVELVARRAYPQAFFGKTLPQETIDTVRRELERNVAAFGRLTRFAPYIAGETFTIADCAAAVHLPLVSATSRTLWGEDVLATLPARDYLKTLAERPSVQRVAADRKAHLELRAKMAK